MGYTKKRIPLKKTIKSQKSKITFINKNKNEEENEKDSNEDDKKDKYYYLGCFDIENDSMYLSGEINEKKIKKLRSFIVNVNKKYMKLENELKEKKIFISNKNYIKLFIDSLGGYLSYAFLAIDILNTSKIPVHTIVSGETASAGTLISIVGKKRYMTEHSTMLIHELRGGIWGTKSEIYDEVKNIKLYDSKMISLYKKYTNMNTSEINNVFKHNISWDLKQCLKKGIVDKKYTGNFY